MPWTFGPGPVFAIEMRAAARRWQTYALRSGLAAVLLVVFLVVVARVESTHAGPLRVTDLARSSETFFYGLVGTQLALVLLAAPAAAAGAISDDRASGSLLVVMTTDLSDAELVLGKLFGRLVPVLGLVACGLPVPGMLALLGGIQPDALLGAYLVITGAAILTTAVAVTVSVWATRTFEAQLATYLLIAVLLLPYVVWSEFDLLAGTSTMPAWLFETEPFWLAFAPYLYPGRDYLADSAWFLAAAAALSAGLVTLSVLRVRAVTVARASEPGPKRTAARAGRRSRFGPSLNVNPVLWREWHFRQSSRWGRVIWRLYVLAAAGFSLAALVFEVGGGDDGRRFAAWVNGLQVAIGMLLFSVAAVTSLAGERAAGSLDVLLTTPLTAREILRGKWWGTFRVVPRLVLLPTLVLLPSFVRTRSTAAMALTAILILAYGAAFTSLGLTLATRIARPGRAAFLAATVVVVITVGWILLLMAPNQNADWEGLALGSLFFGPGDLTFHAGNSYQMANLTAPAVKWCFAYLVAAVVLMVSVGRSFDRCLGRVRQGRPPQMAAK